MNKIITITLFSAVLLSGCRLYRERIIYETPAASTPPAAQAAAAATEQPAPVVQTPPEVVERRFAEPQQAADPVQSAVEWAKKYEQVLLKNAEIQEKHNQLFIQNTQLASKLEQTQAELERTRKELDEANVFLQQMHTELNKWKSDVLGFRDEMRQAQAAQLEALSRILQVLGAEPVQPPTP